MASQPQPLCPPTLCPAANGGMGTETGDAVVKPPVRPKPRMLPKPALPAKPCAPPPSPGSRAPRLDFPSAEKINLLAGPKPYSGSSTTLKRLSFSLKSPPAETSNGKGLPSPEAKAPPCSKEDASPAPLIPPAGGPLATLKGAAPFKVKPVPVAVKPERFPGTTVEEILAKMERPRKEGLGSPDSAWGLRSTFSPDAGSRFGPKGFAAFRRQASTEAGEGGTIPLGFEAPQEPGLPKAQKSRVPYRDEPVAGGKKREGSPYPNGQCLAEAPDGEAQGDPGPASRESGSSPAGASCDGDPSGRRRPLSPPGFSSARPCPVPVAPVELPLGVAPGSPSSSAGLAPAAPYLPAEHPASAPGSPALPAELPAPCSPLAHTELPPYVRAGSPETPESLAKDSISLVPAPGAPYSPAEPCLSISHSPGSPETPGEVSPPPSGLPEGLAPGSPAAPSKLTDSPPVGRPMAPGLPAAPAELSPTTTHSPGAPKSPILSPDTPSLPPKLSVSVSQSPGSPDGPVETPRSPDGPPSPEQGSPLPSSDSVPMPTDEAFQPPQLGLRRASDGVVQLPGRGLEMGVLGGSLAALPRGGPSHCGQPLQGDSNWSLSQSFEWAFPSRVAEWEPPRSPIREADDSGLSDPCELDGEGLSSSPKWPDEGSDSEGLRVAQDGQDTEAAGSSARLGGVTGDLGVAKAGSPVEERSLEATCPGGPEAQREPVDPAAVGEAKALWEEQGRPRLGAPLQLTTLELEPGLEQAAPVLLVDVPRPAGAQACQEKDSAGVLAPAGGSREGLQPGEVDSELHPHERWLDELLASPPPCETKRQNVPEPGEPAGSEGLLGWSRKDLCTEFGIGGMHRAGELGWASEQDMGKADWVDGYGASETEQDREFGTATRDWGEAYKEPERLQEPNVGHGNWPDAYSMEESCRQEGAFGAGNPDWSNQYNMGCVDSPDGEFGTRKLEWSNTYSTGESAQQDSRFRAGQPDWTLEPAVGDTAQQEKEWPRMYSGDTSQQDREFSTSKSDWSPESGAGDPACQDKEFGSGKPGWSCEPSAGDTTWQEREFCTSKLDWTHESSVGDTALQDREFGSGKPDWPRIYGRDADQKERGLGTCQPDWTHEPSVGDTAQQAREWPHMYGGDTTQQDREFGTSKLDWMHEPSVGDTAWQDREFGTSESDWSSMYSGDTDQHARELGTSQPGWTQEPGVRDTTQQDGELGTSEPDWAGPYGFSPAGDQGEESGAERPAWTQECSAKSHEQGREWTRGYSVGDTARRDKDFSSSQQPWTHEFGVGAGQDGAFSPDEPAWLADHSSRLAGRDAAFGPGAEDSSSLVQAPEARKAGWSGAGLQESKFSFARRDCAPDFRIGGAEHESQFGVIGTERAGGFGLATLECAAAGETLGPGELGETRPERAGHSQVADLEEPGEAGVGQPDWAGGQGLGSTESSASGGWMNWACSRSPGSTDPSSSLEMGSNLPREPGVGQSDETSDNTGSSAATSDLGHLGTTEAGERQFDRSHELSTRAESSAQPGEVAVGQMDWASEAGIGCGEQPGTAVLADLELHGDSSAPAGPARSGPSLRLEEMLAKAATQRKSPSEERGLLAAPGTCPALSLQEDDGRSRPDGDGAPSPSEALDGGWPPREARRLSQPGRPRSQPSLLSEDFAFLEDTEILDSAVYRSRANLGRKRGHRAPGPHPAGTSGLSEAEAADWMFRDSTEPRPARQESSDEEVAEEPQSRRARSSSGTKGIKVPLFPGLSPSALKAKLRGRNRSVEEGVQSGEVKPALPKEPHVQRSKSCKLPGLGGKPLVLPPKPEKSSGSDATSPHWLQALKLKKKKS